MADLIDVPHGMKVIRSIVVKRLQSGIFAEVFLVMRDDRFEGALFLSDKYKAGPPIPQPLETPNETSSHWMGVRPSVGLSPEEAEKVISEVEYENMVHKKRMDDRWGKTDS